jgi:hypothetical protein
MSVVPDSEQCVTRSVLDAGVRLLEESGCRESQGYELRRICQLPSCEKRAPKTHVVSFLSLPSARFRRNGCVEDRAYDRCAMMIAIDIDMRIVRLCLRAGRLQARG